MKILFALAISLFFVGCASAGPVVTNVSYEADGNLAIEKCMVKTNFFLGTEELNSCTDHTIKITK